MTGMIQPELPKYKEDIDTFRHDNSGSHNSQTLQRSGLAKQGTASPVQLLPSYPPTTAYPSSHSSGNGTIHHNLYGQAPQESPYYTTHPSYTIPASAQYQTTGPPDLMASTAQIPRPYPPMYQTPQSSSPASIASQPQEQHGRNIYGHPSQVAPQMFNYHHPYSMNPIQPSPYATHPSPQHHPLTSQSLMMSSHKAPVQMAPHQSSHIPTTGMSSSPVMKLDTSQHPLPQQQMLNPPSSATTTHGMSTNNQLISPPQGSSSGAAPGPIPATTPLVVRQDSNGVQWIAFEYSRDRIKMQYTIRCDVESVVVDTLTQEFKTENCVYPRACCSKDQYRGNRLVYETECNAVGWALAELNPALRGKRGLIQRAVDSWRNSNQDTRLRSRRVRRQAKLDRRQQSAPAPSQLPPGGIPLSESGPGPGAGLPTMPMGPAPRRNLGPMSMGPPQMHHHRPHHQHQHQPDGISNEEVSGTEYSSRSDTRLPQPELRANIFHETPTALTPPNGPSMPPLRENSLSSFSRHPAIATATNEHDIETQGPTNDDLFSQLPGGKRRKFILVDDPQRGCRVRVKVVLDKVNMDEIPDSYRESNAVYPRTYFPIQMRDQHRVVPAKRFFLDDPETQEDDPEEATLGRTTVPVPSLDGDTDTSIEVPKISRKRHRKELLLNDLGYRMSWSQSRVFSGRMLFLQRSLDAYRNKMRSSMLAGGQDAASIPEHFDTRRGKRRFLERGRRDVETVAQRSVEEVEC